MQLLVIMIIPALLMLALVAVTHVIESTRQVRRGQARPPPSGLSDKRAKRKAATMTDPESIPTYSSGGTYQPGQVVMGTDGNLWQRYDCMSGGGYWQRMPVLNVDTRKLEHKA